MYVKKNNNCSFFKYLCYTICGDGNMFNKSRSKSKCLINRTGLITTSFNEFNKE